MAKAEPPKPGERDPEASTFSIRARPKSQAPTSGLIVRPWRGRLVIQKAPEGHKRPRSVKERFNRDWFYYAVQAYKTLPYDIRRRYEQSARNPWLLARDVWMAQLAGRLFSVSLPDGRVLFSPRAEADVSTSLDVFSTAVGAMLARGQARWQALPPGPPGYVLTSQGEDALPAWSEPSGGGGGGAIITAGTIKRLNTYNFVNWWTVSWEAEDLDEASFWDAADPTKIYVPGPGYAIVTAYLGWIGAGGRGPYYLAIYQNGSTLARKQEYCYDWNAGPRDTLTACVKVSHGDYFDARMYNGSGSGKTAGAFLRFRIIHFA